MTVSEFKAWFEGYTENLNSEVAPSKKQWTRIKERIAEIKEAPVPVYQQRRTVPYYSNIGGYGTVASNAAASNYAGNDHSGVYQASSNTFYTAGKAEAADV